VSVPTHHSEALHLNDTIADVPAAQRQSGAVGIPALQ
jgi:hypothetical protein